MHILVTNDDGVHAPGLLALAQALKPLGKVTILAPDRNWSVAGHKKTMDRPLRVHEVELPGGEKALATDGSPSDCVAMVALGLLDEAVDLVASGINPVVNLGHDLTYSGTVTAALEGVVWRMPAIAVSLDGYGKPQKELDFGPGAAVAAVAARQVLENGLPPYTILNINVPRLPLEKIRGFRVTRQGPRVYHDELIRREDPMGHPYYWIGGSAPSSLPEEGSDFQALQEGYVSVNPIHLDLTAHDFLDAVRGWNWPEQV